jgi:LacI family transcriptional regulator
MPPSKNPASKNPATITDVARLAGVSPGTVSKALNGRGALSLGTIARIQQAAEQLGYQPNALARGLLAGRTFTVGLITTDSFGRFSIPVMQGAEDALGPGRIAVLLCDSRDDQIREQHYLRTLLERRVDGIIVTGRRQDPREPIGSDIPVPVVYAMTSSTNPGDLSLVPDDAEGGAIAVRHLLSTGRTRIGHVTGPMSFAASRLRAQGAEQTLAAAGLELAAGGAMYGEWTEEWGRQATDGLLRAAPDLDAIFCGNDQIARGVADAVREAGARGHRAGRLRQLGGHRGRQQAAADHGRHEPARARPDGGRGTAQRDRRTAELGPAAAAVQPGAQGVEPPTSGLGPARQRMRWC